MTAINESYHSLEQDSVFFSPRQRKILRKNISLQSCLDETIQLLHIPNNIKIKSNKSDLRVLADPIQLQIVCNNILINAIQAIGQTR